MCHDGTGLRGARAEAGSRGLEGRNRPPQKLQERRSGRTRTEATLENRPICAGIAVALLEPGDAKTRRSGSKSGSGRWSHWDEIGWSHSDEIRWVQSEEILQLTLDGALRTRGSRCEPWARRGSGHCGVPGSRRFDSTICGTPGPVGTSCAARACRSSWSSGAGSRTRWCFGTRIWRRSICLRRPGESSGHGMSSGLTLRFPYVRKHEGLRVNVSH